MAASVFRVVWIILLLVSACGDPQEVTVKPGQDVSLLCKAPTGGPISLIAWSRPDLKADGYVFFLRDGLHMNYQHPSYVGRVELRDPDMKDGDASVVLKNVTVNDSGTYECRVGKKNKPELIGITRLTVSGSAGNISAGGNKDQGNKDKGNPDGRNTHVGLTASLSVVVMVVAILFCL